MSKLKVFIFALCTFSVTIILGCSTYTPKVWKNPSYTGAQAHRQLLVDDGQCVAVAFGSVKIPQTSGQQASVNVYQQQNNYQARSRHTNIAQGMAYVQQMGAKGAQRGRITAAQRAQRRVYTGCMASRGWLPVPSKGE